VSAENVSIKLATSSNWLVLLLMFEALRRFVVTSNGLPSHIISSVAQRYRDAHVSRSEWAFPESVALPAWKWANPNRTKQINDTCFNNFIFLPVILCSYVSLKGKKSVGNRKLLDEEQAVPLPIYLGPFLHNYIQNLSFNAECFYFGFALQWIFL